MAGKVKRIQSNLSKGELSPRLFGRPDLAAFFNGAATVENYLILPQGGVYRPAGTRFIQESKDSTRKSRLLPFVFSRTQAYFIEFGHLYCRIYKNMAYLGVELVTPYTESDIFSLHITQSLDVLFIDHKSYQTRKLSRVDDATWAFNIEPYRPPPTFEAQTDLNSTLTPGATAGTNILFTAGSAIFLDGDQDRNIISGTARAIITVVNTPTTVHADILDNFASTSAIAAHGWFLDRSPSSGLDADKKSPVNGKVILKGVVSSTDGNGKDTFRAQDVEKFVNLLGGVIEITKFTSTTEVSGLIRSTLSKSTKKDPDKIDGGDWTLEVPLWDATQGFPGTPVFYQGRLGHGGSPNGQTTLVLSASDDFDNYARGALADRAIQFVIASGQLNAIRWMIDLGSLFIGTVGQIFSAKGSGVDQPLGGDNIPFIRAQNAPGTMAVQPVVIGTAAIYIEASGLAVHELSFNFEDNTFRALDLTRHAEHITNPPKESGGGTGIRGLKQEQIAWVKVPNRHMYFIRNDGQLAALTYFRIPEDVVGWSRRTTEGLFESHCAIPHPDGDRDQHIFIVNRTIAGATKRYVEYVEDNAAEFVGNRAWTALYTDCAKIYSGAATITITGLSHLEGKTVDVIADSSFKGTKVVASGQITLPETHTKVEVGLHYDSTLTTMPVAVQDAIIDDQKKCWQRATVRFKDSIGAKGNGEDMIFNLGGQPMDISPQLFTGKKNITLSGITDEGQITITQPYPMPQTILSISGRLNVGD